MCTAFSEYLLVTMAQRMPPDPAAPYVVESQETQPLCHDIVLLKADTHRNDMLYGRVIETLPSTDGRV